MKSEVIVSIIELSYRLGWLTLLKRFISMASRKVIREKSCGEGSLIGQDTIENVSEPKFFFLTF